MKDYPETASAAMSANAREGFTLLKGLLYAIGCIQSLPDDRQERSDMIEMCAIARRVLTSGPEDVMLNLLWSAEHHIGQKIDLWPAHGGEELNGLYTDEELDRRDDVRGWIDDREAQFQKTGALKDAPPSNVVTFIDGPDDLGDLAA